MPYKRRNQKNGGKRRGANAKSKYPKKKSVKVHFDGAFPNKYIAKFVTNGAFSMTGTTGALNNISVQMNSINDVFGATSNLTAPGKANLLGAAGPYVRYRVYKGSITVSFINTSTTVQAKYCVYLSDNSTALTDMKGAMSQPYARYGLVDIAGGSCEARTFNIASTRQIVGRYDNSTMSAAYNANPSEIWYAHVLIQSVDESSTAVLQTIMKTNQWCVLTDRFDSAQGTTA